MRGLIERIFFASRFGRRLTMLASSTVLGQLAVILAAPLLTRLYTPADYGAFVALTGLIVVSWSDFRPEIRGSHSLVSRRAGCCRAGLRGDSTSAGYFADHRLGPACRRPVAGCRAGPGRPRGRRVVAPGGGRGARSVHRLRRLGNPAGPDAAARPEQDHPGSSHWPSGRWCSASCGMAARTDCSWRL